MPTEQKTELEYAASAALRVPAMPDSPYREDSFTLVKFVPAMGRSAQPLKHTTALLQPKPKSESYAGRTSDRSAGTI